MADFFMRPYVTRRVVSPQGEIVLEIQPHVVRRVISKRPRDQTGVHTQDVTNEGGTGVMANVDGFEVARKNRTNEKLEDGRRRDKQVGTRRSFQITPGPHLAPMTGSTRWSLDLYGSFRCAHMSSPFLYACF